MYVTGSSTCNVHEFEVHDDKHRLQRNIFQNKLNVSVVVCGDRLIMRRLWWISHYSEPPVTIYTYFTVTYTFVPCTLVHLIDFKDSQRRKEPELSHGEVLQTNRRTKKRKEAGPNIQQMVQNADEMTCAELRQKIEKRKKTLVVVFRCWNDAIIVIIR